MSRQASRAEVESFVEAWAVDNVRSVPGSNPATEVDRLAAGLTCAARAEGISGRDIHQALGDIDDYLTALYQRAAAPQTPDGDGAA